jgi:hypothetical protein
MDRLRTPLFLAGCAAAALVVLLEVGSGLLISGGGGDGADLAVHAAGLGVEVPDGAQAGVPPGRAIGYLALVDGVLLFTLMLMAATFLVDHATHAKLQGVVTLVGATVLILIASGLLALAIAELVTMVTLLLAVPFGTIAYLITWGSFPRGHAAAVLSLLMALKLAVATMLVLAQPRLLRNKGLVFLVASSLLCTVLVAFLHGLAPGILVSITDTLGAIVVAVVAIVWGVILLIGAIPAVVKAVRAMA